MLILKILLGVLLFLLFILLLALFGKIRGELEWRHGTYYLKVKFLGLTLFRQFSDKEMEMLLKKGMKKAKKGAEETVAAVEDWETQVAPSKDEGAPHFEKADTTQGPAMGGTPQMAGTATTAEAQEMQTPLWENGSQKTVPQAEPKCVENPAPPPPREPLEEAEESLLQRFGGLRRLLAFARGALSKASRYFIQRLVIERMILDMAVASEDMAVTAQLFAYINALVYRATAKLGRYIKIRKQQINIFPDFTRTEFAIYGEISISMRAWNALLATFFIFLDYRRYTTKKTKKRRCKK